MEKKYWSSRIHTLVPYVPGEHPRGQTFIKLNTNENPYPPSPMAMEAIRRTLGTNFCRRCNYCAPCTTGIPISAVFLMEGYFSRYDLKDWAVGRYMALDRKASDCIGCGDCESRCPYNLPIRQMLKNAAEKFGV